MSARTSSWSPDIGDRELYCRLPSGSASFCKDKFLNYEEERLKEYGESLKGYVCIVLNLA
jgi:hypothetical protein